MKRGRYLWVMLVLLGSSLTLWFGSRVGQAAMATPLADDVVGVAFEAGARDTAALRGAQRVIDYGSFVWALFPRAAAPSDMAASEFALTLGGLPVAAADALPADWTAPATADPDLHLLQFVGPTRRAWLAQLAADGVEVVQYIHPFTYVVWGTAAQLEASAARSINVRWHAPLAPAYRVPAGDRAARVDQTARYDLLVYRGADRAALDAALTALGDAPPRWVTLNATWATTQVTLDGAALRAAARLPGVYALQAVATDGGLRSEQSTQIVAGNFNGNGPTAPGYLAWLADVGVTGEGVVVAHVDDGILETHPDLAGRVLPLANCVGTTCSATYGVHGTHTAGIVAGTGASGIVDNGGFLRGLGVAPGATLVEQRYFPTYTTVGGMTTLMRDSYANGAVLSTNSWGPSGTPRGYDNNTLQVDIAVRDAATILGNQPLIYVLSFMNGYGGTSTQGTPDEAKNVLTTGSTRAFSSGSGGVNVQSLAFNDISVNSGHGPALDGRTIPHLVAPGCLVDSTSVVGSAAGYQLMCGTSMAAPHVAGAVALFVAQRRAVGAGDPSPALVKAAFAGTAHSLVGNADADGLPLGHAPDSRQGWGRIDIAAVLSPTVAPLYYDQQTLLTASGEEWQVTLRAQDASQPVRLMLAWSDAPGHGLGGTTPAWVNDLDLIVMQDGTTYRGNVFGADGYALPAAPFDSRDSRNNLEGIVLAPSSQPLAITVRAANLAGDGVPNNLIDLDQDFALACFNCIVVQPTVTPTLTLTKQALPVQIVAGDEVTFSVRQTMTLPGGPYPVQIVLTDTLPAGMQLLTDTLRLAGQPVTATYDPVANRFVVQRELTLVDAATVELHYRARYALTVSNVATLTNTVQSATQINGTLHERAADVTLYSTWGPRNLFVPLLQRSSER